MNMKDPMLWVGLAVGMVATLIFGWWILLIAAVAVIVAVLLVARRTA